MTSRLFYIVLFSLFSLYSWGQNNYTLTYKNDNYKLLIKNPKKSFKDSANVSEYLSKLRFSAIDKGFLLASIDSVSYSKTKASVYFYLGDQFKEIALSISTEELSFIQNHTNLNEKYISQIPFKPKEYSNSLKKILNSYLNNGYPFVSLKLEEEKLEELNLSAHLKIKRGKLYRWNKIHIKGDSSSSKRFISNLIDIKENDIYDESKVKEITNRINQIPYLVEIKPSEILFTEHGAELYIYIKSNPISSINGVLGLQPSPSDEKISITGELNLKLLNTLKRGELLDIRWQSIREETQSLKSKISYPFLFNTPFGVDGNFTLYKRDTSFIELNSSVGVQYILTRGSFIKGYYQSISSSVLSGGSNNPEFSNLGNVKSNYYGLAYSSNKVDYIQNPRKGTVIYFESSVGNRKAQVNDSSQIIKSFTYRGKIKLEQFIPLFKRHVLRIANQTEFYGADEIFENEVFRFGGLTSQRGFNEDELFATTKNIFTLEYRFLLDKNSHVFLFADQTWYENISNNYYNDTPFGFGLGFAFSTDFGTFSISYALGQQLGNQILLSDSKIHFGYIAYF